MLALALHPASAGFADDSEGEADADEVIQISGELLSTRASAQPLSASDVNSLPGASNDAMRALASSPAASRLPFSFGGIAVRGASIRNTSVYLDGVALPLPFHFGGVTSVIPSSALASLALHPGNFEAAYGRAIGGVVLIAAREPQTDRRRAGMDVSILHASAWAEGAIGRSPPPASAGQDNNRWGALLAARRSFVDLVFAPFVDDDTPLPSYTDAQLLVTSGEPRAWGKLTPFALYSRDQTESEDLALTMGFWRVALPWRHYAAKKSWQATAWMGATDVDFRGDMTPDDSVKNVVVKRHVDEWGLRGQFSAFATHTELRAGVDAVGGTLRGRTGEVMGPAVNLAPRTWMHVGAWTSVTVMGAAGSIVPSLRVDFMGLADEVLVSPRVHATWQAAEGLELLGAAGRFAEPPLAADFGATNASGNQRSSTSWQYSFGARALLFEGLTAEATGYYHRSAHLPVITDPAVFQTISRNSFSPLVLEIVQQYLGEGTPRQAIGSGRSYGLESLIKYARGRQRLQLAYTWSRSKRTENPAFYQGYHPYVLDQPHRVHAYWQYAARRWEWGAALHFATGIPYSPVTLQEDGNVTQNLWGQRIPAFFQLDVRAARTWQRARGTWSLYLEIQNATARTNVESIRDVLDEDEDGYQTLARTRITGLPLLPILGVMYVPR